MVAGVLANCASSSTPTSDPPSITPITETPTPAPTATLTPSPTPLNPLTIDYLRQRDYPGSAITIEQTRAPGSNYNRYIASYFSDGLKIYALLTVPKGAKPKTGFPVIIFNNLSKHLTLALDRSVAFFDKYVKENQP
jgi:hypothetical protein